MTSFDFSRPLPDSFFSRTNAVFMGVAVGVTLLVGMLAYSWVFGA